MNHVQPLSHRWLSDRLSYVLALPSVIDLSGRLIGKETLIVCCSHFSNYCLSRHEKVMKHAVKKPIPDYWGVIKFSRAVLPVAK